MDTSKLIEQMLAARNKFLAAASALDTAIAALDATIPATVVPDVSGDAPAGALFPQPHGDPA